MHFIFFISTSRETFFNVFGVPTCPLTRRKHFPEEPPSECLNSRRHFFILPYLIKKGDDLRRNNFWALPRWKLEVVETVLVCAFGLDLALIARVRQFISTAPSSPVPSFLAALSLCWWIRELRRGSSQGELGSAVWSG